MNAGLEARGPMKEEIMKAAVVGEKGVEIRDVAKPVPKPHEILIKVRAASLNRADLAVAAGHRHGTVGGPAPSSDWNAPARSRRSAATSRISSRAIAS